MAGGRLGALSVLFQLSVLIIVLRVFGFFPSKTINKSINKCCKQAAQSFWTITLKKHYFHLYKDLSGFLVVPRVASVLN